MTAATYPIVGRCEACELEYIHVPPALAEPRCIRCQGPIRRVNPATTCATCGWGIILGEHVQFEGAPAAAGAEAEPRVHHARCRERKTP